MSIALLRSQSRTFHLTLISFALFGALFGVWQVAIADLQSALNLSDGALGGAITIGFLASFPTMLVGGRLADRFDARTLIAGTALLMAVAFVGFSLVDRYVTMVVLLMLFFGASGAYDVGINAAAIGVEQQSAQRVMTYFHAAFSGTAAITALGTGVLLVAGVPFRTLYLLVTLMMVVVAIAAWRSPDLAAGEDHPTTIEREDFSLYREPAILLLATVAGLAFLSEGTLETWSAIYLRRTLVLGAMLGAAGPAVFHTAMLVGRLGSARVIARIGRRTLVVSAGALAAGGMILALATTQPAIILLGILLAGLALAGVVPAAFSLAGDLAPARKGETSAVITTIGYGGFLVGPALIGGLAEQFGLRAALAALIIAGLLIVALGSRIRAEE